MSSAGLPFLLLPKLLLLLAVPLVKPVIAFGEKGSLTHLLYQQRDVKIYSLVPGRRSSVFLGLTSDGEAHAFKFFPIDSADSNLLDYAVIMMKRAKPCKSDFRYYDHFTLKHPQYLTFGVIEMEFTRCGSLDPFLLNYQKDQVKTKIGMKVLMYVKRKVKIILTLGEGRHSVVLLGLKSDGEPRVFKFIPIDSADSELLEKEVTMMKEAQPSESVVRYYNHFTLEQYQESQNFMFGVIEMEWIWGGTLETFLEEHVGNVEEKEKMALWLFGNAAVSIQKMHLEGVHHYDMHLGNFLVDARYHPEQPNKVEVLRVVVADFGEAGKRPGFVAILNDGPELFGHQKYDRRNLLNYALSKYDRRNLLNYALFSRRDFQRFCKNANLFGKTWDIDALKTISDNCLWRFRKEASRPIFDKELIAKREDEIVMEFKTAAEKYGVELNQALWICRRSD